MLIYSPQWLFLLPGFILSLFGGVGVVALLFGPITIKNVVLDGGTMIVAAMSLILGVHLIAFGVSTKIFAIGAKLIPKNETVHQFFSYFTLERGLLLGLLLIGSGFWFIMHALLRWQAANFGPISYSENIRNLIPGTTLTILGVQTIFTSFFLSVLSLKTLNLKT